MIVPQVYEQTPQGERAFDIYSRLLQDRIVLLSDYIEDNLSNLIVAQLLFLEAEDPEKDIYLYINSPGGGVTSVMAIYDTINFIRANVSTICTGIAGASAALLLSTGARGKRSCLPNAKIMLHQVYGAAEGPAIDVRIAAAEIERQRSIVNELLAQNTGQPLEKIEQDTQRDFYLEAQEAIKYGIVDQIITSHRISNKKES
jgi:ATP-dependent Clp protease protease subunit